ncbi:MAG TPA: Tim44/TimA family putative adaptor protein, partial [Candidatus Omnitrophota bacterium]|nr:Tim44/TimA family putative adaptor protein [Candidatus Omnitrophota bacterium]
MNDGLPFFDILFFAMVAAFLVLRLRSMLGRRTGNERPPTDWTGASKPSDNVIDLASARKPAAEPLPEGPVGEGVAAIRAADPSFSMAEFVSGARAAFAMIVEAFAAGDKATLKPLLSDDVYRGFAQAIDARVEAGETLQTELVSVRSADLVDARMRGSVAEVTVRFRSE